jgi:hypothetical protein
MISRYLRKPVTAVAFAFASANDADPPNCCAIIVNSSTVSTPTGESRSQAGTSHLPRYAGEAQNGDVDRILEHLNYLRETEREGLISAATASQAKRAWFDCSRSTGYAIPVPAACTGADGQLQYAWDRDEHHLELNFSPEEAPFFFYRNRTSGEVWIDELENGYPSERCIESLRLFS